MKNFLILEYSRKRLKVLFSFYLIISLILITLFPKNTSSLKVKKEANENSSLINFYILFEYTYTCGTWYNRGKEVCNQIEEILSKNGINVIPSIKPYHIGELPSNYNGEFNIYLTNDNRKILIATSELGNLFYHEGLKNFAYTFFQTDEKTGERNYLAVNPQREDLLKFVLKRSLNLVKENNLANSKNYYVD